jgi:membrane protein DedA with SNARE-associated domain
VGGITEAVTGVIGDAGVYAVFALMLLDAVFPAASEIVMLYAGALAAGAFPQHEVNLFGWTVESTVWGYVVMALAGTIGYWLGSVLGWCIGRYGGRPLLERHGRWFHLTPEKLARADAWFERYGDSAVFLGRVLPVVRSFIAIPAGVVRTPFPRYLVLTFAGSALWCFGFAGAGLALGEGWERVHEDAKWADYVIAGAVVLAALLVAYRAWRRRARKRAEARSYTAGS